MATQRKLPEPRKGRGAAANASEDMAYFGASDAACYLFPAESQQAERDAYCRGAASMANAHSTDGDLLKSLAQRLHKTGSPALGFDQGDVEDLYRIACALNAPVALLPEPVPVSASADDQAQVTQADRIAAHDLWLATGVPNAATLDGARDDSLGVQAFAKHRLAALAKARGETL